MPFAKLSIENIYCSPFDHNEISLFKEDFSIVIRTFEAPSVAQALAAPLLTEIFTLTRRLLVEWQKYFIYNFGVKRTVSSGDAN